MTNLDKPNLASPLFKANPYPFYAQLRANAPVYRTILPDKQTAWLVTRYDDVAAVLKDARFAKDRNNALSPDQSSKQPWMPAALKPLARNMLDLDAPDHTRLRSLVHKAFTPRTIESLRVRIEALSGDLLDKVQQNNRMDLIRDFALPLPVTVIADLLGVPPADRHKFHAWSKRMVSVSSASDKLLMIPSVLSFMRFLRNLFKLRRATPGDDLTSLLVQVEEAGDRLSEDELLATALILLIAGHETTVNLIGSGSLALIQNPDQLALLRSDPTLIQPAVEELLRFTSPVEMATERYAREDVTIAGITIPQGGLTLAVLGSANRDETQFPNPTQQS